MYAMCWPCVVGPALAGNVTVRADRHIIEFDLPVATLVEGRQVPAGVQRVERWA
jgi:hypothetical protein